MGKTAVLFTCYNRMDKTIKCIESVEKAASLIGDDVEWFVIDGGSKDDTVRLLEMRSNVHVRVATGAFYSQGMRFCMDMLDNFVEENEATFDSILLVNDDVSFYDDFLGRMLELSASDRFAENGENIVLVGATCHDAKQTYGGVRYRSISSYGKNPKSLLGSVKYDMVKTDDDSLRCHTFNANCVLIPWNVYRISPRFDENFVHCLGDFDYGMCLKGSIYSTDFYVGDCASNSAAGTWTDKSLGRSERVKKLNEVKGAPTKQWFYYLNKHFGPIRAAVYSISPYVRIILGR